MIGLLRTPRALLFALLVSALSSTLTTARVTSNSHGPSSSSSINNHPLHRQTSEAVEYPRHYHLIPPDKIKEMLYEWVNYYPDLVRLENAQDKYGLPTAGDDTDCPHDDDVTGCKNYILTIQDFTKHPEGSDSSNRLPEVFLSGELHGNERVGPTAVMEAAQLMLLAADCEAKPRHISTNGHSFNEKGADWQSQLKAAKDCRAQLETQQGMKTAHRKWLARIVSTRRIVIVPTANALGYYRKKREEGKSDPNRDFPFDVTDATACFKTIAGRTLNEIFREHMFQLSLTFHGGMEVVAYEWGAPTYYGPLSPDDTAQAVIAGAYSQYGGKFSTSKQYDYGTMNDKVYYVRGGFEDWAYAGSWDPDRVIECQPTTFGGYDKEKSKYDGSSLRVFNMLVETSNTKNPADNTLGTSLNIFDKDTLGNGHVSRNIRLSLLACDAVQPYVHMVGVNDLTLTTDVLPLYAEEGRSCQSTQAVMVPGNQEDVSLRWTVGGAFDIDSTQVWYAKWDDVPADVLNCNDMPSQEDLVKYFTPAGDITSANSGTGFFSKAGPAPLGAKEEALGPVFSATLDVSKDFKTHDKIVVIAGARVDQSWKEQPKNVKPELPPQSHVVNARTNPDWHHESAGKIIQGRLDWYSLPLTIVVGDYNDNVGTQGGRPVGTVELSNRFGETTGEFKGGVTPSTAASSSSSETSSTATSSSPETSSTGGSGSSGSSDEPSTASAGAYASGTESTSGGLAWTQIVGVIALMVCVIVTAKRLCFYRKKPKPTYSAADTDDAEYGAGYSDDVELPSQ